MYIFKDVNGVTFLLEDHELYRQLQEQKFKVFGFDLPTILALSHEYFKRGGPMESNPEEVEKVFKA